MSCWAHQQEKALSKGEWHLPVTVQGKAYSLPACPCDLLEISSIVFRAYLPCGCHCCCCSLVTLDLHFIILMWTEEIFWAFSARLELHPSLNADLRSSINYTNYNIIYNNMIYATSYIIYIYDLFVALETLTNASNLFNLYESINIRVHYSQ